MRAAVTLLATTLAVAFAAGDKFMAFPWTTANPANEKKHCLCGVLDAEYLVHWTMHKNLDRGSKKLKKKLDCNRVCGNPGSRNELCIVYKRTAAKWVKSSTQPKIGKKSKCGTFFPADKSIADWESAADQSALTTPTGHKKIHYFWWGNPAAERHQLAAKDGATKIANLLQPKGWAVNYWRQVSADSLDDLDGKFTQKKIGAGGDFETIGDILAGTDLDDQKTLANNLMNTFNAYGPAMFAAVKDFSMMCILYKEGGFFADTNVQPNEGTTGTQLAAALSKIGKNVGYPRLPMLKGLTSPLFVPTGDVPAFGEEFTTFGSIPTPEVNFGYAPKNHPALKVAIKTYIFYWDWKLKGTPTASPWRVANGAKHTMMSRSGEEDKVAGKPRANIVGKAVTYSYGNGMYQFNSANLILPEAVWLPTTRGKGTLGFNGLHLTKYYGNTWRQRFASLRGARAGASQLALEPSDAELTD